MLTLQMYELDCNGVYPNVDLDMVINIVFLQGVSKATMMLTFHLHNQDSQMVLS